jgi:hypothetical protein
MFNATRNPMAGVSMERSRFKDDSQYMKSGPRPRVVALNKSGEQLATGRRRYRIGNRNRVRIVIFFAFRFADAKCGALLAILVRIATDTNRLNRPTSAASNIVPDAC